MDIEFTNMHWTAEMESLKVTSYKLTFRKSNNYAHKSSSGLHLHNLLLSQKVTSNIRILQDIFMLEYDKSHLFGGNDHIQFPNSKYIYFTRDLCVTLLMIANMIYKGILLK